MYERFTDRSRKVMQLASQEAQRFGHEYVSTEHVLIGLLKEGSGVAANVLKSLDVDLGKLRSEVERLVKPGKGAAVTMGSPELTDRAKKAVAFAVEESKALRHSYVGTEHLLLGLLRDPECVACACLHNLGVKSEAVRAEVMLLIGGVKEARVEDETVKAFVAHFVSHVAGAIDAGGAGPVSNQLAANVLDATANYLKAIADAVRKA